MESWSDESFSQTQSETEQSDVECRVHALKVSAGMTWLNLKCVVTKLRHAAVQRFVLFHVHLCVQHVVNNCQYSGGIKEEEIDC